MALALALRAIKGRALTLTQQPDSLSAHAAGLAASAIGVVILLEITGFAIGADKVAQRAAAGVDGRAECLPYCPHQTIAAFTRNFARRRCRMDASAEQRLAGVDVAHAHHGMAVHEYRLYCGAAAAGAGVQPASIELGTERFRREIGEQGVGKRILRLPQYRAEAARIGEPGAHSGVEHQVEVIVLPGRRCAWQH